MAFRAGEVEVVLKGNLQTGAFDAYDAKVRQSGAAAEAFEKKHTKAMNNVRGQTVALKGTAIGLGAVAAGLAYAAKQAGDFEQQLNVFKATSNATGKQMQQVSTLAKKLGADVKLPATSAKDAADAMTELAKGGLSVRDSMEAARGVLQLSAAAQIANGEAANIVANNLQAFSLRGRDATKVADLLAAAANASTATIPQLAQGLQQSAASAHNLGITLPDTVALLTELSNKGIQGSDAGTSLKTMLQSLVPNSKQAGEAIGRLGVKAFDAKGEFVGIRSVVDQYHDSLSKLNTEQRAAALKDIFGTDATRAASIIFGQGAAGLDKVRKSVNEAGAAQKLAEAQTKGFNGALAGLKSTVETIAISLGMKLLPSLTDATHALTAFFDQTARGTGPLSSTASDLGDLASGFLKVSEAIGATAALGALFGGLGQAAEGAVQVLHGAAQAIDGILHGDFANAFKGIGNIIGGTLKGVAGVVRVALSPISGALDAIGVNLTSSLRSAVSTAIGLFDTLLGAASSTLSLLGKAPGFGWAKDIANGIDGARKKLGDLRASLTAIKAPPPVNIKIGANPNEARAALRSIQGTKIENKVVRILGNNQDAMGKTRALIALGIPPKTAKVLGQVGDALGKLGSVRAYLNSINSKSITIGVTTLYHTSGTPPGTLVGTGTGLGKRAAGRSGIGAETALVGEGGGPEWIVDPAKGTAFRTGGPTVMDLTPSTYVVPTEDKYRGRALGFMQMLASDLGLEGYAKGKAAAKKKAPAKKARPIPAKLDPLSLPVEDIDAQRQSSLKAYTDVRDEAHDLPGKIRDDEKRVKDITGRAAKSKASKAKKSRDLKAAKKKLADDRKKLADDKAKLSDLRAAWQAQEKRLREAQDYQRRITKAQSLVDLDVDDMALADRRDDQGAYDTAKRKRTTDLKALRALFAEAQKHVGKDSQYFLDLQKQISDTDVSIAAGEEDQSQAQQDLAQAISNAPDPMEDLTAAEKARLAGLDKDVALAALTPDLGDDATSAGAKRDFLQGLLSQMTSGARPASDSLIGDVAGQLKSSMDNVASLSGTGTNDNADLQAQLDQAKQQAFTSATEARVNAAALAAFGSSGDIGAGGSNALNAARGMTINVNTLHPGDPATVRAIGDAATAGIGYQGFVSNPRAYLGV